MSKKKALSCQTTHWIIFLNLRPISPLRDMLSCRGGSSLNNAIIAFCLFEPEPSFLLAIYPNLGYRSSQNAQVLAFNVHCRAVEGICHVLLYSVLIFP